MINSRAKGKSAEREVILKLKELLPSELTSELSRNLEQTRNGGHDIVGLPGWAIEVKRYAKVTPADMTGFWEQATEQARKDGSRPALAYREDRRDWRVVVRSDDVNGESRGEELMWTFDMSLPMFCELVRSKHVSIT